MAFLSAQNLKKSGGERTRRQEKGKGGVKISCLLFLGEGRLGGEWGVSLSRGA